MAESVAGDHVGILPVLVEGWALGGVPIYIWPSGDHGHDEDNLDRVVGVLAEMRAAQSRERVRAEAGASALWPDGSVLKGKFYA